MQTELRAKSVTQRPFIGCSCCNPYSLEVVQFSANNAARRTVKTCLNFGYAKTQRCTMEGRHWTGKEEK